MPKYGLDISLTQAQDHSGGFVNRVFNGAQTDTSTRGGGIANLQRANGNVVVDADGVTRVTTNFGDNQRPKDYDLYLRVRFNADGEAIAEPGTQTVGALGYFDTEVCRVGMKTGRSFEIRRATLFLIRSPLSMIRLSMPGVMFRYFLLVKGPEANQGGTQAARQEGDFWYPGGGRWVWHPTGAHRMVEGDQQVIPDPSPKGGNVEGGHVSAPGRIAVSTPVEGTASASGSFALSDKDADDTAGNLGLKGWSGAKYATRELADTANALFTIRAQSTLAVDAGTKARTVTTGALLAETTGNDEVGSCPRAGP